MKKEFEDEKMVVYSKEDNNENSNIKYRFEYNKKLDSIMIWSIIDNLHRVEVGICLSKDTIKELSDIIK